jgi:hypothetical protein
LIIDKDDTCQAYRERARVDWPVCPGLGAPHG